ncbi:MAG: ABC transporter ATP-binding protein [Actinobacteria bacterium]|nr:MAG: ABC transporter ATP-binding protein [Actinomycetota bacterium]
MSSQGVTSALKVSDLRVAVATRVKEAQILTGISFSLGPGKVLGLVGESGCGKTTLAMALCGLLPRRTTHISGSIDLAGVELIGLREQKMRRIRGNMVSYIPQDPMAALDPLMTIGSQISEAPLAHLNLSRAQARDLSLQLLRSVQLPDTEEFLKKYPHQLSGGMRQRVMIAIAMSCKPTVIIADEPTTALDVTVQAEILLILRELCVSNGTALILVSHDLGVVAQIADEIAVLYAGEIVELAPTNHILTSPRHPYTEGLLRSVPKLNDPRARNSDMIFIEGQPPDVYSRPDGCRYADRCMYAKDDDCAKTHVELSEISPGHYVRTMHPRPVVSGTPEVLVQTSHASNYLDEKILLRVSGLSKNYGHGKTQKTVVKNVSFKIPVGKTFGLIGESGSGKTTVANCVLQLVDSYSGEIYFNDINLESITRRELRKLRQEIQVVFQDAHNSMDSRMTVGQLIAEPLRIHFGTSYREALPKVMRRLKDVGLGEGFVTRYPRECSGGEMQRACIARALILNPSLLICDEAVASLDVSNGAQVLNLIRGIQREEGLSILFISHDFAAVNAVSDVIGVMKGGDLVEQGDAFEILSQPKHEYTRRLLDSVPQI